MSFLPSSLGREQKSAAESHGFHFPWELPGPWGYLTKVRNFKKNHPAQRWWQEKFLIPSTFQIPDKPCNILSWNRDRRKKTWKAISSHDFSHQVSMSGQLLGMCFCKHKLSRNTNSPGRSWRQWPVHCSPNTGALLLKAWEVWHHAFYKILLPVFSNKSLHFWLAQVFLAPQCSTKVLDLPLLPPVGQAWHA